MTPFEELTTYKHTRTHRIKSHENATIPSGTRLSLRFLFNESNLG